MTNTPERIDSRIGEAEEQVDDLEDRMVEITAAEQNMEKRMERNEDSLRHVWDNIKWTNIHIIGVPVEEGKKKFPEKVFGEIITENFTNMRSEILTKVQESQSPIQ